MCIEFDPVRHAARGTEDGACPGRRVVSPDVPVSPGGVGVEREVAEVNAAVGAHGRAFGKRSPVKETFDTCIGSKDGRTGILCRSGYRHAEPAEPPDHPEHCPRVRVRD